MAKGNDRSGLKIETVELSQLTVDPANLRKHPEKNLQTVVASLKRFGQQKPIVVDREGVIVAGNGTFLAAQKLGWENIAIVRTQLHGPEAIAYAIADNRAAELAQWDADALASTLESLESDLREAAGYLDTDMAAMGDPGDGDAELDGGVAPEGVYEVAVACESEGDQKALYGRMVKEGRKCRVVTI